MAPQHSVAWNARAGETVETLRVPTSPQGEHSLVESLHDVCCCLRALKIVQGFANTCWKSDTIKANARSLVLFWPLPNVGTQNFSMWGMYNLAKSYRSIKNPLPIAESKTGKPAMVMITLKIQLHCSMVHDMTPWANIFVCSHTGCGTDSVFICLCMSHKYCKDAEVMQINRILKISQI